MTRFPYLDITAEHDGQRHVLRLQGELDICNEEYLRRAISCALEHHPPTLVLDLSALGFMDCSGLSVLVWAHKLLAGQQRQLLIAGSQPIVRRLICLMGLDTYLHLSAPAAEPDTPDQSSMLTLGNRWRQRTRPPLERNGERHSISDPGIEKVGGEAEINELRRPERGAGPPARLALTGFLNPRVGHQTRSGYHRSFGKNELSERAVALRPELAGQRAR